MPTGWCAGACTWVGMAGGGLRLSNVLLLGLGLGFVHAQALQVLAGALGHVLPLVGVHVGLRLAGAGMAAVQVGAVVLARLDDAIALLLALGVVGSMGADAGQPEGEHTGKGGSDDLAVLAHGKGLQRVGDR